MELSVFDIQYKPRLVIRSQALADLIIECILSNKDTQKNPPILEDELASHNPPWILHVDGSSTILMSKASIILTTLKGMTIEFALRFTFLEINNEVEYEAPIIILKLTEELDILKLRVFSDS